MSNSLPSPFVSLRDLVDEWALPTERARMEKRFGSSFEKLQAFYDRIVAFLPAILEYLSRLDAKNMSPEDERLLSLTLSLADVSVAVERVKAPRSPAVYEAERLELVHELPG